MEQIYYRGWKFLHLRLSGNAPELRVYVETASNTAQILLQNAMIEARNTLSRNNFLLHYFAIFAPNFCPPPE